MRYPLLAFAAFVALLTFGHVRAANARCARMALGHEIRVRRIASGDAIFVEAVQLRPHSARAGSGLPDPLQLQPEGGGAVLNLRRQTISPRVSAYISAQPLPPGRYRVLGLAGSVHFGQAQPSPRLGAPDIDRLGYREQRAGRRTRRIVGVRLNTPPPDSAVEIVLEQGRNRWSAPIDDPGTAIAVYDFFGRCETQPAGAAPLPGPGTPVPVHFVDRQGRDGPDVVSRLVATAP